MDHNVSAAAKHFHGEDSAAEQLHMENMATIFHRIQSIRATRADLEKEEATLRKQIVETLGVEVGDIITRRDGKRLEVIEAVGDFDWVPFSKEDKLFACVRCKCAPETANGFHKTQKVTHTEYDDLSFNPALSAAPAEPQKMSIFEIIDKVKDATGWDQQEDVLVSRRHRQGTFSYHIDDIVKIARAVRGERGGEEG